MKKKSVERFNEIVKTFALYGFGIILDSKVKEDKKAAESLRKAFETLGPTFIKIGQILSTRRDIIPDVYIKEFIKLQDSVNEESYLEMKEVFEKSLGKTIDESFFSFNKKPIAAGSIAQVYDAVLKDGKKVVVKIQKPDIYAKMKLDISILKRILKFTKINIHISIINFHEVINELEKIIDDELNFNVEGNNAKRFRKNNEGIAPLYVPKIIETLWSDKVLTLEKIDGFKINNIIKLKDEGYDNEDVAEKLILCYCRQVFQDGFFHGDPHPGNILIYNGKICFVDFGIMGEIAEGMREYLNKAILAIALKDKEKLVEVILNIGVKKGRVDKGLLYEDVSYIFDSYMTKSIKDIKISIFLEEIFKIAINNNIEFPRELVTLFRSLIILEGVLEEINSNIDILSAINSYMRYNRKLNFVNEFNKREIAVSVYGFMREVARIPSKINEVLNSVYNGRGKINFHIVDLDKTINALDRMVNRLTGGLIISALLIASSLLIRDGKGPLVHGLSLVGLTGYLISSIFAMILLGKMLKRNGNKKKN